MGGGGGTAQPHFTGPPGGCGGLTGSLGLLSLRFCKAQDIVSKVQSINLILQNSVDGRIADQGLEASLELLFRHLLAIFCELLSSLFLSTTV